ncbi:unnamed protein product [Diatraea saccharalis]|uniref:Uncharacterized protein n=1 Tax=Diatraea saccharalis TaxID=40085 RepID=A0A9N9WGK2_9NEOP|nr:unnamed protein product [Diatraea saccharalis]
MAILDESMNISYDLDTTTKSETKDYTTKPSTSKSFDHSVTLEKISQLMDQKLNAALSYYTNNLRTDIKTDMENMVRNEIQLAVQGLKDEFLCTTDFICAEQKILKTQIDNQNTIIKELERDNNNLKIQLKQVESKLSTICNLSRNLNLEIHAVPECKDENVILLFQKLCQVVGTNIDNLSVRACRRVAKMNLASKRPRNILVILSSSRQRDEIISAVHRYNKAHHNIIC